VADAERLLEGLDPEQREVACTLDGPLRVLAGAGTGKTRAITHRIAYGVATGAYSAPEVLAVTFTTRAAGELRSRLATLGAAGVQARTFHSAALRQARYFWPQVYGGELPALISSKLPLLAEAAGRNRHRPGQAELRDLAGEIEWAKVTNVSPEHYARLAPAASRSVDGFDAAAVAAIYATYEEVKRDRRRIDMEDVLLCAAGVLSDDERVAAAVRRQYRQFVVDEFQDVSPLQAALLDLWLGSRDDVCVVGDPAQTIYSFAGASPDYLLEFKAKHPKSAAVTLVRNYRSTPQVIDVANTVLADCIGDTAVRLRAVRGAGPGVTFGSHSDEVAEAAAIAQQIQAAVAAGTDPAEIAVLYRVHAASENFEEALAERSIPFVVRGNERFFDRSEVRQAVVLLRGAARSQTSFHGSLVDEAAAVLTAMGWSADPPAGRGSVRDRWESLKALVSVAEELAAAAPAAGLPELVEELQRRQQAQQAPIAAGVTLATLHAAKGLEWSTVFLVGMHEGTMPFVYATTSAAIDEERRLLYVGITRARDSVRISWSAARSPGGRPSRGPSRFLSALVGSSASERSVPSQRRRTRAAKVSSCRVCSRPLTDARERKLARCADCPSTYDEALHATLREWRRQRAADEKVPAYCVFTDATLTALAELVPADTASLVRVPGIGPAKAEKYGAELVGLCRAGSAT
jgi:DNA helicase-2/ATP-dependent DNA helicase PcrA